MSELSKLRIWKISEGANGTTGLSDECKQKLLAENTVAVYGDTKAKGRSSTSQGEYFEKGIKTGDFFYLCYGNKIVLIGQFIGNVIDDNDPNLPEGFLKRKYKTICQLESSAPYNGPQKWWTSNDNSTCIPVPLEQINEFNEYILSLFPKGTFKKMIEQMEGNIDQNMTEITSQLGLPSPQNIILYGPPGTGKTYSTIHLAMSIIKGKNYKDEDIRKEFNGKLEQGQIAFVTFHQSYSYEDFIEGIRPKLLKENIVYTLEDGIFKKIAENAAEDPINQYVVIIDEINRGNISKIFGELITLIEPSKRLGSEEATQITLPYSKKSFSLPPNLHIIGTMNSADRSIALLDTALRRRFNFKEMMPKPTLLNDNVEEIDLQQLLEQLNKRIESLYDRDHTIGHAYLMQINSLAKLQEAFTDQIIPLLQEYFYGDWEKIRWVLNDTDEKNFIRKRELPKFPSDLAEKFSYTVNPKPDKNAFKHIYEESKTTDNVNSQSETNAG